MIDRNEIARLTILRMALQAGRSVEPEDLKQWVALLAPDHRPLLIAADMWGGPLPDEAVEMLSLHEVRVYDGRRAFA